VLSLFFIDRVDNFIGNPPADKTTIGVDGLYPGIIRELFDDAFETLKLKYQDFSAKSARDVRGSYFAKKKRRGGVEDTIDSSNGQSAEDRAAYNLIMKDKDDCCRWMSRLPSSSRIAPCAKGGTTRTFVRFAP